MDKNSEKLVETFHTIAKKGYIQGVSKSWGNIGLTFEKELGKSPDSKYDPDYEDIEIKCSSRFSRYPLYLFTIAFDGPSENEILRLAEIYGHYDNDYKDKKVLFEKVSNKIIEGKKYNFMLEVNRFQQKIYLAIYDEFGTLIEKQTYIRFDTLKKHLQTKLEKIAYVKASKKKIDDLDYYRYYSIFLYHLKNFDTFLNLIDRNGLEISVISRISKSGVDEGRYRNKNVVFSIRKENIFRLFDCYYQYDYDRVY